MLLQMQTQHSKMSFNLDPDVVGELIQAAFRYASNMAQLQPGWSEGIAYQDGQRAWDSQEVPDIPEGEESPEEYILDLTQDEPEQPAPPRQTELGDKPEEGLENSPGPEPEPTESADCGGSMEKKTQDVQDTQSIQDGWEQDETCRQALTDADADTSVKEQPEKRPAYETDTEQGNPYPYMHAPYRPRGYKGFLLIKCQQCGKLKGFCAKTPINSYFCNCGWETPLSHLKVAIADCECGQHWIYRTNAEDNIIEVNCIECGNPIDMSYNPKKKVYATIQDRRK